MPEEYWKVVGGQDKGGILVRAARELKSAQLADRLSYGAVVLELASEGERLHYELLEGSGPSSGWVSIKLSDRNLLVRTAPPQPAPPKVEEEVPPKENAQSELQSESFDPYKILNISSEATDKQIKSAFRKLSLTCHPDRNPDDENAAEKFRRLVEAKELLLDPFRRQMYNNEHGIGQTMENPHGFFWLDWDDLFDELDPDDLDEDDDNKPAENPLKLLSLSADTRIDLIVYGGTGHTGMLACMMLHPLSVRTWAIAGRDERKLALIGAKFGRSPSFAGAFRAESTEDIQKLARTARVIVDLSGPKWQVGTRLVEACIQFGAHYVEASGGQGDALVNKQVQDTFDSKARDAGVSLVYFCGWGSTVLDFGTWCIVEHFRKSHAIPTRRVDAYRWHHGFWPPGWGPSGTHLLSLSGQEPIKFDGVYKKSGGPFLFGGMRPGGMREEDKDTVGVIHDDRTGMFVTQGTLHDRVVPRCSCGLFDHLQPYGDDFLFKSWVVFPTRRDADWLVMSNASIRFDRERYVNEGKIAGPGQGPWEGMRYGTAVTTIITGEAEAVGGAPPHKAYVTLACGPGGVGEPIGATAAFTLNAAICLLNALDHPEAKSSLRPGFGTPVYHLAHLGFLDILEELGCSFRVFPGPAPRELFRNIVSSAMPIG